MKRQGLLLIAIILLGLNLRPVLAAIGPLLDRIQLDTGLDHVGASLLTSLPVVIMGLGALAAGQLRRRLGDSGGIFLGTLLIAFACLLRGLLPDGNTLVISALLAGAGIAFVQALLPGLIKSRFAADSGRLIGFYSCAIMAGAAFGAAFTPWLAQSVGWSWALAGWALPALLGAAIWHRAAPTRPAAAPMTTPPLAPWRWPRAWLLMSFFGIGTAGYTLVLAWLPPYYTALGWSAQASGLLLAALTLVVLVALLLGIGIGGLFPLSLVVAQDHLEDPQQTGDLLAFVQGGGYLIAACAPLLAGVLRRYSTDLSLSWQLMALASLLLMVMAVRFSPGHEHRTRGMAPD